MLAPGDPFHRGRGGGPNPDSSTHSHLYHSLPVSSSNHLSRPLFPPPLPPFLSGLRDSRCLCQRNTGVSALKGGKPRQLFLCIRTSAGHCLKKDEKPPPWRNSRLRLGQTQTHKMNTSGWCGKDCRVRKHTGGACRPGAQGREEPSGKLLSQSWAWHFKGQNRTGLCRAVHPRPYPHSSCCFCPSPPPSGSEGSQSQMPGGRFSFSLSGPLEN